MLRVLGIFCGLLCSQICTAQLLAFPTAEGAGKFVNFDNVSAIQNAPDKVSYLPDFMVNAVNYNTVNIQNNLLFYQSLIEHKVNASLHTFPQGAHGIKLDDNPGSTDLWLDLLEKWLKEMNFIVPNIVK